jgi:hypothetical protein
MPEMRNAIMADKNWKGLFFIIRNCEKFCEYLLQKIGLEGIIGGYEEDEQFVGVGLDRRDQRWVQV